MKRTRFAQALFALCVVSAWGQTDSGHTGIGRIQRVVLDAKKQGITEVQIPPPIAMPTGVDDLDTVARDYSVVVAALVKTLVTNDLDELSTWYKFEIRKVVTQQKNRNTDVAFDVPGALLPIASDEVVLRDDGGKITIDGIMVLEKSPANIAPKVGQQYLLALYFLSGGRTAQLGAYPDGVFSVSSTGALSPTNRSDSGLAHDVQERFGGRLERVQGYLQSHHAQQPIGSGLL